MEDSSRLEALLGFKENEVFELSREMLTVKQKSEHQCAQLTEQVYEYKQMYARV